MSATEHVECDDDKGGYKAGLLCHGRVPDGIFWLVPQEPVVVFVVIPWTVLLLIRRSRHIDSEGPPLPWGRAQFVGMLGPGLLLLLLLLLLLIKEMGQLVQALGKCVL
jgi:hypothetical protein